MISVKTMLRELEAVLKKAAALRAELETKGDAVTEEEFNALAALLTQGKQLKSRIETVREVEVLQQFYDLPEARVMAGAKAAGEVRSYARYGRLKNFTGATQAEAERKAYRFGQFAAAALTQNEASMKFCSENGIELKTMKETINTAGGVLVPTEFDNDLIDLRETYGVFRKNARVVPMMRDTKDRNRRTSGLTAYFVGEAVAPTESEKAWDQVSLTARKLMTLTRISSELNEDVMINLGDDLAGEIGYAFALKEDQCGFLGDGTSTYGGIVGLSAKFLALHATIANIAGVVVAAGNLFSEFVMGDFTTVVGKLPEYADGPSAKWYCSKFFWATVMERLAIASGGVTSSEIAGKLHKTFLGYPVEIVQVMPKVDANSQIACYLGDLRLASDFGDRRQTTIALSDQRYFDTDEIGIKGTERFDINNHDVGNADATAANRVEGPIIGLISAAS